MFPYMDSITALTTTETNAVVRRVQTLDADQRHELLFRLVGRMSVSNPDGLLDTLAHIERENE